MDVPSIKQLLSFAIGMVIAVPIVCVFAAAGLTLAVAIADAAIKVILR